MSIPVLSQVLSKWSFLLWSLQPVLTCSDSVSNKLHELSSQLINFSFSLFVFSLLPHPPPKKTSAVTPLKPLLALSIHLSILRHLLPIPKVGQSFLAFQRYKLGADSALFSQDYTDPSQDAAGAGPYTSFGGEDQESPGGGGQASSDAALDGSGGYQRQDY